MSSQRSHPKKTTTENSNLRLIKEEKYSVLNVFNDTGWMYPMEESLVFLFEKQACRYPENPAVFFGANWLSYKELDNRSNQVANCLLSHGIEAGQLVLLCMERSVEWLVAVLGILKTGASYVPRNPAYSLKHIDYIAGDVNADMIIASGNSVSGLLLNPEKKVLFLDQLSLLNEYSAGQVTHQREMGEQQFAQYLLNWHQHKYALDENCRLSLAADLDFDSSVWEIWSALTCGGSLHIAGDDERRDVSALLRFFSLHQITHGYAAAALVPSIINQCKFQEGLNLRYLFTGVPHLKPSLIHFRYIDICMS